MATVAPRSHYYVQTETRKGIVVAYTVCDCIGGMESEHARFEVNATQSQDVALHLANSWRDDANNGKL